MSLRWRIMGATVLVVVLAVLISVAVGYYATQSRLGEFVDEIGDDEAIQLARNLSREYTAAGGWDTADRVLSEAGYSYGETPRGEGSDEGEEDHLEAFHRDRTSRHSGSRKVVGTTSRLTPAARPTWRGTVSRCST